MPNHDPYNQHNQMRNAQQQPQHRAAAPRPSMNGARMPQQAVVPQAAAQAVQANPNKGNARITIIVLIVCLLVVGAVGAGIWFLFMGGNNDFYDNNSIVGQAPYKTDAEIQAELDRKVEEGMLNISIASEINFNDGNSAGTAYIENVPSNRYAMQVDIVLDETGETIYQSGGLKPDSYISDITLTRDLDKGVYPATATFHALDPETLQEVGRAAANVTLNVEN